MQTEILPRQHHEDSDHHLARLAQPRARLVEGDHSVQHPVDDVAGGKARVKDERPQHCRNGLGDDATDIIEASAKAYVDAINRMIADKNDNTELKAEV